MTKPDHTVESGPPAPDSTTQWILGGGSGVFLLFMCMCCGLAGIGSAVKDRSNNPLPSTTVASDDPPTEIASEIDQSGKWGLVGLDGSKIVPCILDDISAIENGHAVFKSDGKFGLIDKSGRILVQPSFNTVKEVPIDGPRYSPWFEEFSKLEKQFLPQGGILRAYDDKRKVSLVMSFSGGFSLIDSKNSVIARLPNDYQITDRRFDEDGRIRFNLSGTTPGMGMIDHSGRVVIERKYLMLSVFSDGLAAAQALPNYDRFDPNAKSFIHIGYIDPSEKWRIEPQWSVVAPFSDGLGGVQNNESKKWGFIDTSGNLVIDYQYDRIDSAMISERGAFVEGRAGVCVDGKWGFIDKAGRYTVKPKYREIEAFEGGVARVKM